MKKHFKLSSIATLVLLIAVISSCKKESKSSLPPNPVVPKPIANASYTITSQYAPMLVKFTNQSQHANSYAWYIGTNKVSDEQNPELLLNTIGNNTIRLVAKNNASDSSEKTFTIAAVKHPQLFHHYTFSNNFANTGSSNTAAASLHYQFAPDRKQIPGSAIYFNGINTFVQLPANLTSSSPDSLSISLWFKPEAQNKTGVIFGYQSTALNVAPNDFAPVIYYSGTGNLYTGFWHGKFANANNITALAGNWVHVVVAANANEQTIYVNGQKIRTIDGRASDAHLTLPYLGATYTNAGWTELAAGNNYFKGWIDDVRVYKKMLNQNEVRALYKE